LHGMAYYIFLKSLTSLEEFRKNPHVKIPPKSPCANFQSLGIFKNQILFRKKFSLSLSAHSAFRPSLFFLPADFPSPPPLGLGLPAGPAHPHGPTGHLLPPPAPTLGAHGAAEGQPHAASTVAPTPPLEEKKTAASIPIISPITRRHFPSSITSNRCLQRRPLKLLQRLSLKTLGLASTL
jgi:hypothetical protein